MENYLIEKRRDQNFLLALVCAGAFIANLDSTIVNIALPTLSSEFSVSPSIVSWTVLAYLLCETGFMLPFGKLSDIKGIKAVYQAGFFVFMIGSILCGMSSSIVELISARAFQGIGGAMLFTVMMAFIPIYLPTERRVKAMGMVTTAAAAGVALGPPIGGWITALFGWRWIFFVNVPFCLASIYVATRFIPSAYPRPAEKRFDFSGAAYSFAALIFFLYAINMGLELGWMSPEILSCFALSIALAIAFIRRERKINHPLLDLTLFSDKTLRNGMLAFSFSLTTVGGVLFLFPFYLEEFRGLNTHIAGMIMMLPSLGQFVGPYTGSLSAKYSPQRVCIGGMLLGILAFAAFLALDATSSLILIVVALGLFGLSQGFSKAPNAALIMACAPPGCSSTVSSIMSLCRSLSMALGVLFFETIFSDSIPHEISLGNASIAETIAHAGELAPGFMHAFAFGTVVSVAAIIFMRSSKKTDASVR